ncbi:hypothetical protein HDU81_000392 [Chytriomyces hyalinus]|nr:hypothetical protein HDU81_000392 [Chytriomyces hyalinus]
MQSRTGRDKQVYTPAGSRVVVGVIPVLPDGRIVLISSSSSKTRWVLPKGGAEMDETRAESAEREAFEEGGLRGSLRGWLVDFDDDSKTIVSNGVRVAKSVFSFYVMDVSHMEEDWPESQNRDRAAFSLQEATKLLTDEETSTSKPLHLALLAYIDSVKQQADN